MHFPIDKQSKPRYNVGMEQITIKKVAEVAGVSKTTISKYLNGGNVKKEYKEKVEEALKLLNYRPNLIAKALKTNRTYTIGILIPFINDSFATQIVANMEEAFQDKGYGILICGYEGNKYRFRSKLNFLLGKMIDAVVVFPSGLSAEDFDGIKDSKIPVCLIDREVEGVNADVIMTDNEIAGYVATNYLLQRGHTRIAFVTGYDTSYTSKRRNNGIKRALQEKGIPEDQVEFAYCYSSDNIFDKVKALIESPLRPTAIFSTNFYLTNKTINALNHLRLRVPEDISLLAFDNVDTYSIYTTRLTILSQLPKQISAASVETILNRIKDTESPKKVLKMGIELVEGDSVKNNL